MNFVKKHLLSILCGVVAFAVVVATLIWPLPGMFDQVKADAEGRAAAEKGITGLLNKKRTWPPTDPNSTNVQPLTQFPNEAIRKLGDDMKKGVNQQATQMLVYAFNADKRLPLTREALPAADQVAAYNFKGVLGREMDGLYKNVLKAGVPPTAAEVAAEIDRLWQTEYVPKQQISTDTHKWLNEREQKEAFARESADLPERLFASVARTRKVYADPQALPPHPLLSRNEPPSPMDIWCAQMNFWIYSDVCDTIASINDAARPGPTGAAGTEESPVKRLVRVEMPADLSMYVREGGAAPLGGPGGGMAGFPSMGPAATAAPTAAKPVDVSPSAKLPSDFTHSPTGRVSNALYDVVHWRVVADVAAADVQPFLKALSVGPARAASGGQDSRPQPVGRFLTVRNVEINGIDYARFAALGYQYGKQAVVQVSVDCESLFLREWAAPYMPADVKAALGVPEKFVSIFKEDTSKPLERPAAPPAARPAAGTPMPGMPGMPMPGGAPQPRGPMYPPNMAPPGGAGLRPAS